MHCSNENNELLQTGLVFVVAFQCIQTTKTVKKTQAIVKTAV